MFRYSLKYVDNVSIHVNQGECNFVPLFVIAYLSLAAKHRFQIFKSTKMAGVKFNDVFLSTEWLERNFNHFFMILPLDFSEILNICRNYSLYFSSFYDVTSSNF